jgi:hypothetical protein
MEPEPSLPCSQRPATDPYHKPIYLRSVLILSSHIHLSLLNGLFPSVFWPNLFTHVYLHACYMPRPPHRPRFDLPNNRMWNSSLCSLLQPPSPLVLPVQCSPLLSLHHVTSGLQSFKTKRFLRLWYPCGFSFLRGTQGPLSLKNIFILDPTWRLLMHASCAYGTLTSGVTNFQREANAKTFRMWALRFTRRSMSIRGFQSPVYHWSQVTLKPQYYIHCPPF